jgi:hypothetical protein
MMPLFARVVFPGLLIMQMAACTDHKKRIEKCVEAELKQHPEAHLVDMYKYFFQDAFGPGHMIPDREGAEQYLDRELAVSERFEPFDYQELIYKNQFVRVNLRMIANGNISKQEFLDAFMQSAENFKLPEIKIWRKEWAAIVKVIGEIKPDLPGYVRESMMIDSMLLSGNYAVHHSGDYSRTYDPHYRLIDRRSFRAIFLNEKQTGVAANQAEGE